jgi:hypothetical protein
MKHSVSTVSVDEWVRLVRAEYVEWPRLHLTRSQVRRLWSLDEMTCDAVIEALTATRFLKQAPNGGYVRAD